VFIASLDYIALTSATIARSVTMLNAHCF